MLIFVRRVALMLIGMGSGVLVVGLLLGTLFSQEVMTLAVAREHDFSVLMVDQDRGIAAPIAMRQHVTEVQGASVSHNGRWVLFASGGNPARYTIYDVIEQRFIPVTGEYDYANIAQLSSWSPSGDRLLVVEPKPGESPMLQVIDLAAEGAVSELHQARANGHWSPDGRYVAIYEDDIISVISTADGSIRRLTDSSDPLRWMVWSPDSRWLAFATPDADDAGEARIDSLTPANNMSGVDERVTGSHLYIVDVVDGTRHRMTNDEITVSSSFSVRWSPDSQWLGFVSGRNQSTQTYTIHLATGALHHVPTGNQTGTEGVLGHIWSPDSSRIAIVARRDGWDFRRGVIYVADPLGENVREVTQRGTAPLWSPDSRVLAYEAWERYAGRYTSRFHLLELTDEGEVASIVYTEGDTGLHARWARSGESLSFIRREEGESRLFAMQPGVEVGHYTSPSGYFVLAFAYLQSG